MLLVFSLFLKCFIYSCSSLVGSSMMTDGGYDNPRAIASVLQNGKINTTSVGKHDILSWDDIKDLLSRMGPLHEIQRLLNNYGVLGIEDLKKF